MKYATLFLLATFPFSVLAHGGGRTIQKESGAYRITLNAVSPQLSSGTAERVNFELERSDGVSSALFSHVWIRIMGPDESFLFSGNIAAAPEGFVTGISYLFPEGGTYLITTRFLDGEAVIAEAELPVLVAVGSPKEYLDNTWLLSALFLVVGLLLGGIGQYIRISCVSRGNM